MATTSNTFLTPLFLVAVYCAVLQSNGVSATLTFVPYVNLDSYTEVTDRHFVSVAVGTRTLLRTIGSRAQFNLESARFYTMARTLAPLTMRLGGIFSSFFIFNPSEEQNFVSTPGVEVPVDVINEWKSEIGSVKDDFWSDCHPDTQYCNHVFSGWWFKRLTDYLEKIGWDFLLDINHQLRLDNKWNPHNFRLLLRYIIKHKIKISGFQLGNEAVLYKSKFGKDNITAEVMAEDFRTFRAVLNEFEEFTNVPIRGPDITSLAKSYTAQMWMKAFMAAGGGETLGAFGLHHYYIDGGNAQDVDFLDSTKMDKFKGLTDMMKDLKEQYNLTHIPVHMTETANAYNGGSDFHSHHFISTYIYLDQLGMCAKGGIKRVHRQSFNSASYALIDVKTMNPYPDYYIALTHKRLLLGPVLEITITPANPNLRIYAHCARMDYYKYGKGAIVIYYANLISEEVALDLKSTFRRTPDMDLYIFESGEPGNLKSTEIKLNGVLLKMVKDSAVPDIVGRPEVESMVTIPQHSTGFIVVKNAESHACLNRPEDEVDTGDSGGIINMKIAGEPGYAFTIGKHSNGNRGIPHNFFNMLRSN